MEAPEPRLPGPLAAIPAAIDGAPKGSNANIARHATGAFDKKGAVKL
jgi:hypothetical protein